MRGPGECERATKLSLTDGNQTRQLMIMPLDRSRTESEKERKGRNRRTRTDGRTDGLKEEAAAKRKNEMKGRMTSGEDATDRRAQT